MEAVNGNLTKDELLEKESVPKTRIQRVIEYLIYFMPIVCTGIALLEYLMVPDVRENKSPYVYVGFIGIIALAYIIASIVGLYKKKVFSKVRYLAPCFCVIIMFLAFYDYLTLKTGYLLYPYFPWLNKVFVSMIADREMLWNCVLGSLKLLFTGYSIGAGLGLITGISCGYSKKVAYWVDPIMKVLGPIPSTTWIPIVMVLAASLFKGSVFIIGLGVWYSVTLATMTGIKNIDNSYYDAAKTLGAKKQQLVFRVAIPYAMPNIFQGLTQGMSSACTALMVAEMVGVESGLGWYISWQKAWAQYDKMYAAIILICIIFTVVTTLLSHIRKLSLRWQEGIVR